MKLLKKDSDFIKILSNTAWMVFDKVFLLVLSLFVSVKIANHYGALGYGSYQYAVSIVAVFEILTTFVDGRVVKKKYLDHDPETVVLTGTMARILLSVFSILMGIVFILIYRDGPEFTVIFMLLLINMALGSIKFGMANRFEYLMKSKKVVIASDLAALTASVLQLIAVQYSWPLTALALIALTSTLISFFIIWIQYKAEFGRLKPELLDKDLLKHMLKESFPLGIAGSCGVIYTRCDSIMLGAMMTSAEVGIYSISVSLINIVQIAIAPIRESVFPMLLHLYDSDRKQYAERYIQISSILTWVYIAGVAFSFVILPYAFRFLNEEYAQAFPVYRLHVLGTFFMYNAALRAGHFTVINRSSILTWSQIVSVIANVVMNFFMIQIWGMYGAALATVITQAVSLMFINLFFQKEGREVFMWQVKALNPLCIFRFLKSVR